PTGRHVEQISNELGWDLGDGRLSGARRFTMGSKGVVARMATHDVGLTPPRLEYVGTALVYRIGDSRVERFFPAGEASPNPAGGRPVGEGVVGHSSEEATPAEPRLARTVSART